MDYEKFPEPEQLKSQDPKFTTGMNKSKRQWKVGVNRHPTKAYTNQKQISWEEKKLRSEEMKKLRSSIREFKEKKIAKRKEMKEVRKERKRQKQYNEIKSGKF